MTTSISGNVVDYSRLAPAGTLEARHSRAPPVHRPPMVRTGPISRQLPNSLGRTHARFTDFIVRFRMDWRSVCRGIDDSCWTVCGDIDRSCWTVCAGIGGSRGGALCAINCFGAPLVGARGFLGFRPLLFGMEREPAAPAGSTFFTFQGIAEYAGPARAAPKSPGDERFDENRAGPSRACRWPCPSDGGPR
jgi:hypothetical protein